MPIPLLAIGAYALVGAGISALWAVAEGKPVTWQTLAIGALGGAVGGGVGGAVLVRGGSAVAAGALCGGSGNVAARAAENGLEGRPLADGLVEAGVTGAVVGGGVARVAPLAVAGARRLAGRVGGVADDAAGAGPPGPAPAVRPPEPAPGAPRATGPRAATVADDVRVPPALGPPTTWADLRPGHRTLRFSQATAGGRGRADPLRESLRRGWDGDPIDAVAGPRGPVAIDNTRPAVALELGLERIPVRIHQPGDPLPPSMLGRFGDARSWGEALAHRTGRQPRVGGRPFPADGAFDPPRLPPEGGVRGAAPSETVGLAGALRATE